MLLNLHFGSLDYRKYKNKVHILLQQDSCSPAGIVTEYPEESHCDHSPIVRPGMTMLLFKSAF